MSSQYNPSSDVRFSSDLSESISDNHRKIRSLKAKADAQRSPSERIADAMNNFFGSMRFLIANVIWFALWLILNVGLIPGIKPFDPYPFNFLTMVVSLEAIILAIFVLIAQNRAAKVAELREEVDLQVDSIAEQELTKILKMMCLLLEKNGIDVNSDEELREMLQPTNQEVIEKALEAEMKSKQ